MILLKYKYLGNVILNDEVQVREEKESDLNFSWEIFFSQYSNHNRRKYLFPFNSSCRVFALSCSSFSDLEVCWFSNLRTLTPEDPPASLLDPVFAQLLAFQYLGQKTNLFLLLRLRDPNPTEALW